MRNTKYDSLTHKLVEFKTETDHFKGFLLKNERGDYYVKPIDVYSGSAKEAREFPITDSQEEFVNFCESPKLMRVSMKSWHYKLMKWVLGSNAPTPKSMQNGCPYFWLLIFCLIATPFILAGQGMLKFFMGFPYLFFLGVEAAANMYLRYVPEETALEINDRNWYSDYQKAPILTKMHFKHSNKAFMPTFMKIRYGIDSVKDPAAYAAKIKELEAYRFDLIQKRQMAAETASFEQRQKKALRDEQEHQRWLKEQERKRKSEAFWAPFNKRMESIGDGIVKVMSFDYKNNTIIKRTKQVIGFLISVAVLIAAGFAVSAISMILMLIFDGLVWFFSNLYMESAVVLACLAVLAAIIGIGYLIFNWIQTAIQNYKYGRKSWYVKAFMYSIAYPIKYTILGIYRFFYYSVFVPLKFLFYTVIFRMLLVNIAKFLFGLILAFGGIVIGSAGIFGEYFGASKKDYCPGIEWTDTED
jgi:hypothetical protein